MKTMMIKHALSSPLFLFSAILAISVSALAAAFISEGLLDLEPCILCIYQRYPYALAAFLGIIGLFLRNHRSASAGLLALCALVFLGNSAIATYHTGVEQKWWVSAVEGCAVTFENEVDTKSFLEKIMDAPTGHCDEIPWQDPIFKLSMANYNALICFGLALFCVITATRVRKSQAT
jgi:disulfide bond formation protein DsbB